MSTPTATPKVMVLSLRDLLHFAVAFAAAAGAVLALWHTSGSPTTKAGLTALAPAVATVLFRQFCPNVGRVVADVSKAAVTVTVDPTRPSLP